MGVFSKFYDYLFAKFFNREGSHTISNGLLNEKIEYLAKNIIVIRELFFKYCIKTVVNCSSYDIKIVNSEIGGKAEIVITAYQLIHILNKLPRYIKQSEEKDFIEMLIRLACGNHYRKCYDFIQSIKKLEESISDKKAFFISVDIAKYLYGHSTNQVPSSFPCLSSYISNGMSKKIADRLCVTESALLIAPIVPKLTGATAIALALCFDDENYAREIESQIELPL